MKETISFLKHRKEQKSRHKQKAATLYENQESKTP